MTITEPSTNPPVEVIDSRMGAALYNPVLWAGGVFDPVVRELRETRYQFTSTFVLDSTEAVERFGSRPTDYEESLRQTVDGVRQSARARAGAVKEN